MMSTFGPDTRDGFWLQDDHPFLRRPAEGFQDTILLRATGKEDP